MSIQIKKEYNNGLFDVQEIYDNEYKILEQPTGTLWNTSEDDPITIAKNRRGEYFETTEPIEVREVDSGEETVGEENNNIENKE